MVQIAIAKDHKDQTPLHYAVNKLRVDLVQLLLNHGVNGNEKRS